MSLTVKLDEVPYCRDSCELFDRIIDLPFAVMLDSSFPHSTAGRYDILTASPSTDLSGLKAGSNHREAAAFFAGLATFQREHYFDTQPVSEDLPFCGGLLGYISYDCGNRLHGIKASDADPCSSNEPLVQLRAYEWCVIQDHLLRRATLVCRPAVSTQTRSDLLKRLHAQKKTDQGDFHLRTKFSSNFTATSYRDAFDRIQEYILAGDCYQVNLAQRFKARYQGAPWHAYRALRRVAAAPFSAFFSQGGHNAIISLSPERFLSLHGQHVETAPIKGTRPRYGNKAEDRKAKRELRASIKDRAENLMIVDLLRNDLGRSCVPGSIHVDRMFEVQTLATVHHLVSTISGKLAPTRCAVELLRDSFPGGSITGAPKRRAMEIIAELEPHARQVYCGSVLYISADGRLDSNIAIRTLLCRDGDIQCWAGGGIVADSHWEQEYQETWHKVGPFIKLLEQL